MTLKILALILQSFAADHFLQNFKQRCSIFHRITIFVYSEKRYIRFWMNLEENSNCNLSVFFFNCDWPEQNQIEIKSFIWIIDFPAKGRQCLTKA